MTIQELDNTLADLNHVEPIDLVYEAYIGKTPILEEAEKQLGKIRENLTIYNKDSSAPEVLKFNRLMEKQFGMDLFALKILPYKGIDAYTMSIGLRFDLIDIDIKKLVTGNTTTGYRFVKDNGLCVIVNVSAGLLTNKHYSDADCMAVILHEIGHNFADCLFDRMILGNKEIMEEYKKQLLSWCIFKASVKKYMEEYTMKNDMKKEKKAQSKRTNAAIKFISGTIASLSYKYNTYSQALSNAAWDASYWLDLWLKNNFNKETREANRNSNSRYSEVVADKFPAIYGYGENLATTLYKIDNVAYNDAYRRGTRFFFKTARKNNEEFWKTWFTKDSLDIEEHPHIIQRIHIELNTLEAECKKEDIDPKVKAELEKQIKTLRKQLDYNTKEFDKFKGIEKAQALFYSYVNKSCPDGIAREFEDEIEKTLDEVLVNTDWNKK